MMKIRVMTLNLGGGIKNFSGMEVPASHKSEALQQLITEIRPDVLAVQELSQYVDADGISHNMLTRIRREGRFNHTFYGETLSMKTHMQVKKDVMVNGLFNDWYDWSKGNALFSRLSFSRLGNVHKDGSPRNIPIFEPLFYEGTRDTDPRYVILSRLKSAPFPFIVNLHLTTLVGERDENASLETINTAHAVRTEQMRRILALLEVHVLTPQLPLIMMGDFNAPEDEFAIKTLLEEENGFTRLVPANPMPTHGSAGCVDHIFFYPRSRLLEYSCRVVSGDTAELASDHLPVVADLVLE